MNAASKTRLTKVHPELATRILKLEEVLRQRVPPVEFEVVQGLRTFAEQDMLYAQGRTRSGPIVTKARGGESNHNYGTACDVAPLKNGAIDWSDKNPAWQIIGIEAQKLGLEWGGTWKFRDLPHVELKTGLTVKQCLEIYKTARLKGVWDEVSARLRAQETGPASTT